MAGLKKAGSNWVDGDRFFDREAEIDVLMARVENGTHTLLTAQRRIGKTSLVRELLRRLRDEGRVETVFVDLEDATTAADAVVEIGVESRHIQGAWDRIKGGFANILRGLDDRIDTLSVAEVRVKLRAGIDPGNWRQKGDAVCAALAKNERPVVLALDELPILVNRMLKDDYHVTSQGTKDVDEFLSWLRKIGQDHRQRMCLILSGSIGLEPILHQAGLSAHANIFSPLDLKPWNEKTALECLAALAETCGLDLPLAVRKEMCRRLRCLVPHHVQRFLDSLDESLRFRHRVPGSAGEARAHNRHESLDGQRRASLADVKRVYENEMLSIRGQADLDHYESRLKMVLGPHGYQAALALLTEAAVNGGVLRRAAMDLYRDQFRAGDHPVPIDDVLRVLEHDGYLEPSGDEEYSFVSGLLQDWWFSRHGRYFVPVARRSSSQGGMTE